jgi:hypothetical protein
MNWLNSIIVFFTEFWRRFMNPQSPAPTPPPDVPPLAPVPEPLTPTEKDNLLSAMCYAVREHEGWYPGSRSQRNNNPGNTKVSPVGYLPVYEPVKKDPQGFAIFKDYATGWRYLENLILSHASKYSEYTLSQYFKVYAPAADNNDPVRYASVVAKKMGVSPYTR